MGGGLIIGEVIKRQYERRGYYCPPYAPWWACARRLVLKKGVVLDGHCVPFLIGSVRMIEAVVPSWKFNPRHLLL